MLFIANSEHQKTSKCFEYKSSIDNENLCLKCSLYNHNYLLGQYYYYYYSSRQLVMSLIEKKFRFKCCDRQSNFLTFAHNNIIKSGLCYWRAPTQNIRDILRWFKSPGEQIKFATSSLNWKRLSQKLCDVKQQIAICCTFSQTVSSNYFEFEFIFAQKIIFNYSHMIILCVYILCCCLIIGILFCEAKHWVIGPFCSNHWSNTHYCLESNEQRTH